MAQVNLATLAWMQENWKRESGIPSWKKDAMITLTNKLRRRVEDNHNELDGVELYYPEDCTNYDAFISGRPEGRFLCSGEIKKPPRKAARRNLFDAA